MSTNNPLPSHKLLSVKVAAISDAARDTKLFVLENTSSEALPASEAGAHIGVHLPNGIVRQYSLVIPDAKPTAYTIAVKRDVSGSGGSQYMIDHMRLGDTLQIEIPRNNFPLEESATSSVFFAGGIGITPIWSMIQRLQQINRPWQLYYAAQTRADAAFVNDLEQLANAHLHFDDEQGGFLKITDLVRNCDQNSHLYCCGPTPMLEAFKLACSDRPSDKVHIEYFTSTTASATDGGFVVELARSKLEVFVPKGKTILDALRDAGVDAPYSCEEGVCGSCEMRVLSGVPDHRDVILSDRERAANKTMMVCCSGSKSPRLVLDY